MPYNQLRNGPTEQVYLTLILKPANTLYPDTHRQMPEIRGQLLQRPDECRVEADESGTVE